MTAWYNASIFYHMYPLGMTGVPRVNPFSWPSCSEKETNHTDSEPMKELFQ